MESVPYDKRSGKIWFNGKTVDWADANIHILNHGLHYASCVFEGERVYDGEIFKLEEHTTRLFYSANRMGIKVPYSENEINEACKKIINIQKVRHFTHFEIIKHSLGIISSVVKITVPQNEINKVVNSSRLYVLFWFLVIITSVLLGSWLPIIMILLPPFYGNTILMICAMTQHAGLKDNIKDHRKSTRTVILNPFFSFLYSNMEYHIEHHIFPKIPCHNLKAFHKVVKNQMPKPKLGVIEAYKSIIPAIFKQSLIINTTD